MLQNEFDWANGITTLGTATLAPPELTRWSQLSGCLLRWHEKWNLQNKKDQRLKPNLPPLKNPHESKSGIGLE